MRAMSKCASTKCVSSASAQTNTHMHALSVEQPRRALYRQCAHVTVTDLNRPPYTLAVLSSRYPFVNPYMLQTMIDSYDMYTVVQ